MKINTIAFGCLISRISTISGNEMFHGTVQDIYDIVQQCIEEPPVPLPVAMACSQVDALLLAIQQNRKIEAIKAYRVMTNSGLKEAKDAVEKYWYAHDLNKEATMGDILNQARHPQY